MRQQHRPHLAIVERGEEFERLRAGPLRGLVDAEQPRPVAAQRGDQGVAGGVELAQLIGARRRRPRRSARPSMRAQPVEPADPALQRPPDQGQEQVVDVEPLGREPRPPGVVEPAREVVGMIGRELGVDPAADDMVVEREARRADRLQHRVAQPLAIVDLVGVGGLEQQAAQVDRPASAGRRGSRSCDRRRGAHKAGGGPPAFSRATAPRVAGQGR